MNTTERIVDAVNRRLTNAESRRVAARVDLSEAATEEAVSWGTLAERANEVARATGYADLWYQVWLVTKGSDGDRTVLRDYLVQRLTENPDDTWSGRGNDARRAYNDGVRAAARSAHDAMQYGW